MSCEELRQHTIQESNFASRSNESRIPLGGRANSCRHRNEIHRIFDFPEDEWVLADLSELHDHVLETLYWRRAARGDHENQRRSLGMHGDAPVDIWLIVREHLVLLHILIQLRLQSRHLAFNDLLNLIGQLALHVFL